MTEDHAGAAEMSDKPHISPTLPEAGLSRGAAATVAMLVLTCAVAMVYGRTLRQPFVFDDRGSVLENSSIQRLRPLLGDERGPGPLNASNPITGGRPLVNLSLALNYRLGQLSPAGYHLFNVVVHLLSAILLWAIVSETLRLDFFNAKSAQAADALALLVALVWALHPLQTECVAYVTQRTELMMGLFYFATLFCSLQYWAATSPERRHSWLVAAILSCLAGAACKEVMVTAPVIVLLFERTFISGSFRRALEKSWPLYAGLLLSWGLLLALNIDGPRARTAGFGHGAPVLAYWATQAMVLLMYLRLALWPWPLVIHYEIPLLDTIPAALPYVLPAAALGLVTLVLIARRASAGFLGAWLFVILSPTLVVPMTDEIAAERRMYLPLAAIVSLVVVGGYALAARMARKTATEPAPESAARTSLAIVAAGGLIVVAICGLTSLRRVALYDDNVTLYQDALLYQPSDWIIRANLASALNNAGRPQEAIEHYLEALRLKPDRPELYYKLGIALNRAGRHEDAIARFEEAVRMDPNSPAFHHELGAVLLNAGKSEQAIAEFREALRLEPQAIDSRTFLATAMLNAGQAQEAIEQFEQVLKALPDSAPTRATVQRRLALALAMTGQADAAVRQYDESLRGVQDTPVERYFLGHALAGANKPREAIIEFKNALGLAPDAVQARYELALALAKLERDPEAIEQLQRVVQSQPENVAAHIQLANLYGKADRLPDAIAVAEGGLKAAQLQALPEQIKQLEALLIDLRSRAKAP